MVKVKLIVDECFPARKIQKVSLQQYFCQVLLH